MDSVAAAAAAAAAAAGGAAPGAEDLKPEEQEMLMWLEMLKESDPEQYAKLMQDLQEQAGGFKPKLPGDGRVMGSSGLEEKSEEGTDVTPDPAFVLKTTQTAGPHIGRKVFVNVTTSDLIALPSVKTKLDADGKEQQGTNIPLSLGPPRPGKDRAGKPCVLYDVIVHPTVVQDTKDDPTGTFRHFLCELVLNYVENKYKSPLSHQYKLPVAKYKGGAVASQRVRTKRGPVIEEVPAGGSTSSSASRPASTRTAAGAAAKSGSVRAGTSGSGTGSGKSGSASRVQQPAPPPRAAPRSFIPNQVTLVKRNATTGRDDAVTRPQDATHVVVVLDLADADAALGGDTDDLNAAGIKAEAAEELLVVACPGYRTTEVQLPCVCAAPELPSPGSARGSASASSASSPSSGNAVTAELDPVAMMLRVELPVEHRTVLHGEFAPDPGSKPWMLAHALRGSSATVDDGGGGGSGSGSGAGAGAGAGAGRTVPLTAAADKSVRDDSAPVLPDEELPEDKFHRADIVSQHILMQRAEDAKEREKRKDEERQKRDKAAKEEEANGDEPKVESVEEAYARMQREKDPAAPDASFKDDGEAISTAAALDMLL